MTDSASKNNPAGTVSVSASPAATALLAGSLCHHDTTPATTYTPSLHDALPISATGSYLITAHYDGSPIHLASQGTTTVQVNARATSTAVSCTPPKIGRAHV